MDNDTYVRRKNFFSFVDELKESQALGSSFCGMCEQFIPNLDLFEHKFEHLAYACPFMSSCFKRLADHLTTAASGHL